jgi:hypothetical protein
MEFTYTNMINKARDADCTETCHSAIHYHKTVAIHCHTLPQLRNDPREKSVFKETKTLLTIRCVWY